MTCETRGFLDFELLRISWLSLTTSIRCKVAAVVFIKSSRSYRLSWVWRFQDKRLIRPQASIRIHCPWCSLDILSDPYVSFSAQHRSQPLNCSSTTTMRFPSVLYLLPSIVPHPQPPPTPAGNVESSADLLSPPPVALGLSQLTSDPVLTRFPARAVSSDSPFDTSALPGSTISSALDSPNSVTPGTFHLRDATPDPSGVCQGLIEDLDITGLGERQQPSRYTNLILQGVYRCPNNILHDEHPHRSPHHILSESLD